MSLRRIFTALRLVLCSLLVCLALLGAVPSMAERPESGPAWDAPGAPAIHDLATNRGSYPQGKIPRYAKLEITFQVDTVAANLQLPYDPRPPAGVQPGVGISVNVLFTPDGWRTVYRQPAFHYQGFLRQVKDGREWIYPSGDFSWKVRFAPNQAGRWEFRLVARDAGGRSQSPAFWFEVVPSGSPGFVRVSQKDPRYFELDDGAYFPALGYNMNFDHLSWHNPVLDNRPDFQAMSGDGIQLVRIWLSQWGIYSASWSPWNSPDPEWHGQYIPWLGLTSEQAYPGSDVSLALRAGENPCTFLGFMKPPPAVKRNTDYRVRVRYLTRGLSGPGLAGEPSGLVAKLGGWLWGDEQTCADSGEGRPVTGHQGEDSAGWQILEGRFNSGEQDFLPYFYLALEDVSAGEAFIDYVWIEEIQGGGQFGPNLVSSPWMAHHLYMNHRNSFAFDQVLDLAGRYGVYLRPVILEKNDWIFNHIDYAGNPVPDDPACEDGEADNDPETCPGNDWFYGDGRRMTKVRWLQQAWWRYLQARWGYSPNIHSWELLNEGDPANELHYLLADELGRYMRQFAPNNHLVSTSFWHSFPKNEFWANRRYRHVDFADIHQYVGAEDPGSADTALATYELSMELGAGGPSGVGKPVIRGEVAFIAGESGGFADQIPQDRQGLWLHNFIWGGINPGGLIESYWYEAGHIYGEDAEGVKFDHRRLFRPYYNFIRDIPLNNGHYQDAAAQVSGDLRAWGQKDLANGRAHLWIHNPGHTWKNALLGVQPQPASGEIRLSGFQAGETYTLQWWDTYQPARSRQILQTETLTAGPDGTLEIRIDRLAADLAIQIVGATRQ